LKTVQDTDLLLKVNMLLTVVLTDVVTIVSPSALIENR